MKQAQGPSVVIGYVRVSTLTQQHGYGLAEQRAQIEEAARSRGLTLTGIEADEVVSGDAAERAGFDRALAAVRKGAPGSVLIVREISRLGRDSVSTQETALALIDADIRLIVLFEGIDTKDAAGQRHLSMTLTMRSMFAEEEKRLITERLYGGRMRAKALGRAYGSEPAYGLRLEAPGSKVLVPDEAEQRAIARIRELAGTLSLRALGAKLIEEGHRPRRGEAWSPSVLSYLINGERPKTADKRTARAVRSAAFWGRIDGLKETA